MPWGAKGPRLHLCYMTSAQEATGPVDIKHWASSLGLASPRTFWESSGNLVGPKLLKKQSSDEKQSDLNQKGMHCYLLRSVN